MAAVLVVLSFATADLAVGGPSGVSGGVVGITLVAAVLHAVWNAVAHGISDRLAGFALIGVAYTIVGGSARSRGGCRHRRHGPSFSPQR